MSALEENPDKNPTPDNTEPVAKLSDSAEDIQHNSVTEPVHEEGGLTFVDIGAADVDPEELEEEFADNDPEKHAEEYTYISDVVPGSDTEKKYQAEYEATGDIKSRWKAREDAVDSGY